MLKGHSFKSLKERSGLDGRKYLAKEWQMSGTY